MNIITKNNPPTGFEGFEPDLVIVDQSDYLME